MYELFFNLKLELIGEQAIEQLKVLKDSLALLDRWSPVSKTAKESELFDKKGVNTYKLQLILQYDQGFASRRIYDDSDKEDAARLALIAGHHYYEKAVNTGLLLLVLPAFASEREQIQEKTHNEKVTARHRD